jgi:hypothetical protein
MASNRFAAISLDSIESFDSEESFAVPSAKKVSKTSTVAKVTVIPTKAPIAPKIKPLAKKGNVAFGDLFTSDRIVFQKDFQFEDSDTEKDPSLADTEPVTMHVSTKSTVKDDDDDQPHGRKRRIRRTKFDHHLSLANTTTVEKLPSKKSIVPPKKVETYESNGWDVFSAAVPTSTQVEVKKVEEGSDGWFESI